MGHTCPVSESSSASPVMGLRERKKLRTRATLRATAFELFRTQGYDETTVAEIAEAAEVSQTTFFRYFPSKEALVVEDDIDQFFMARVDELETLEGNVVTAIIRHALTVFASLDEGQRRGEAERLRLLTSTPSLRGAWLGEQERSIALLADTLSQRFGLDEFDARVIGGALMGASMASMSAVPADGSQDLAPRLERIAEVFEHLDRPARHTNRQP
jgi:AcrR family transcriptional regulator